MNATINVGLKDGNLSVQPLRQHFTTPGAITWVPETPDTVIQGIALVISPESPLPRFKGLLIEPEFTAEIESAAPTSSWQYLLQVNGIWFSLTLSDAAGEPEEPPELVNDGPGL